MINFRNIFSTKFSVIGLIIIILLMLLIWILEKSIRKSLHHYGIYLLVAGLITLVVSWLINTIIKLGVPHEYQIFVNIININLQKNFILYSIISIATGLVLLLISSITLKKEPLPNE